MRSARKIAALAATTLATATTLVFVGATGEVASAHGACPHSPGSYSTAYGSDDDVTVSAANIRTGNKKSCTSRGLVSPSHNVYWWCSHYNGAHYWNYGVDHTTGKKGWVRSDMIYRGAISYRCPA